MRQPEARRCKRPDVAQPRQFRRTVEPGRWGWLRPSVRGTDGSELATRDNPRQALKKLGEDLGMSLDSGLAGVTQELTGGKKA